ncbi:DUF3618 domain-containing protein [Halomonas aquamarina]|uniref:DUF3618 domain-containing protein n=1 Tax=Vreelandella aquamarina TaxID=77097 RepID=A0ACC5VTL4_9GAMM|nr:DUF3618 domain-containing protein [Halomonas aquamarina]MBZ5487244.1 DUF3618 domain-containing protein [Halomonas aquamarina]
MTDHHDQHDHRSAEEIEKDIHRSRERLDSTLHEIEERFSPQQLLNTSYDYIRHGGANEFVSNLGTTIKQNPLPFLVTTAGLGWLMLAQRHPGSSQQPSRAPGHYSRSHGTPGIPVHEGTHAQGSAPGYTSSPGYVPGSAQVHTSTQSPGSTQAHGSHQGRMSSMTEGAKDKAQQFGEKAKDVAHQLSDKAHNLGDKAHHMGGSMRDSTSHLQHGTQDHLHNLSDRARHMGSSSSDFIQEHPLVVGALGVALGAALASLFPTTRKEDEYLGEYRDRALHKAAETGHEQVDRAQQKIHEKAEHMKNDTHGDDKHSSSHDTHSSGARPTPDNPASGSQVPGHNSASGISSSTNPVANPPVGNRSPGLASSNTPSGNTQGDDTLEPPKR